MEDLASIVKNAFDFFFILSIYNKLRKQYKEKHILNSMISIKIIIYKIYKKKDFYFFLAISRIFSQELHIAKIDWQCVENQSKLHKTNSLLSKNNNSDD